MAGAVAVGAKVEIETMPGYLPTIPVDAPEELVEAAKLAAGDKYNVNVVDATSTPSGGSTDVGDVQHLQPVFTFNTGGAVGSGLHSVDFVGCFLRNKVSGFCGTACRDRDRIYL